MIAESSAKNGSAKVGVFTHLVNWPSPQFLSASRFSPYLGDDVDLANNALGGVARVNHWRLCAGRFGYEARAQAFGGANRSRCDQVARSHRCSSLGAVVF